MKTIRKRTEDLEEFSLTKLELSLKHVQATDAVIDAIISRVQQEDVPSTGILRVSVWRQLKEVDPVVAAKYIYARTFRLRVCDEMNQFQVRLNSKSLQTLGIMAGNTVILEGPNSSKHAVFATTSDEICQRCVGLHSKTISIIQGIPGEKIAIYGKVLEGSGYPKWLETVRIQP